MKPKEAIIIGGGLGGLAVALRLAAKGMKVTVCEQGKSFGGKMNTWESQGFRFDTGPSLITMPWVFAELFEAAGSRMEEHLDLVPMNTLANYSYDDGTKFTYTSNLSEWIETIRNLEPADVDGFMRLMKLGAKLFEISRNTFLNQPPLAFPGIGELKAMRHFPLQNAWGNYARAVSGFFKSPHLQQLYNRYPTYVGSSPYLAPATLLLIPYVEFNFNGWYPMGGLYRIVEAITALAKDKGVSLLTEARVDSIERENGEVKAIVINGGAKLKADIVIANCEAGDVKLMLGQRNATRLGQADRSMSGLVFLLGIKRNLPELQHHQIFFSADYRREFDQLFTDRTFPDDPTVYVNCPSHTDRSTVPGHGESLFIMANAPANDGNGWDAQRIKDARNKVFRRLDQSGFPAIADDIVVENIWTPDRLANQYLMPGGAIYGTHSHGWRKAFLRPPNQDRTTKGLYYVGGSTHPGGGTPTVLLSAKITAELIQKNELE